MKEALVREKARLLRHIERKLNFPILILGIVWVVIFIVDVAYGLNPFLQKLSILIWIIFVVDFLARLYLAPVKTAFLRANVLVLLSLLLPALRAFAAFRAIRALQVLRATRGLRLLRVITAMNRGMTSLSRALGRARFGYLMALTLIVTFAGGAGMFAFERNPSGDGLNDYGTALWWTAMIITTMGSQYWPRTPEGRLLCLLLATYGFTIFGYVTATIATVLLGNPSKKERAKDSQDEAA